MYHHFEPQYSSQVEQKVDQVLAVARAIQRKVDSMAVDLTALTARVARVTEVVESAVVLLRALAQLIRDAQADPIKVAELAASLDASAQALADAVAENTPAA